MGKNLPTLFSSIHSQSSSNYNFFVICRGEIIGKIKERNTPIASIKIAGANTYKGISMTSPINILIADDQALVRAGFRMLLQSIPSVEQIAEVNNGQGVIDCLEIFPPDLILMNISMPILNGIATTAILRKKFPDQKIIILSTHADDDIILQDLHTGINGYLLKNADLEELTLAIDTVFAGRIYLRPPISRRILKELSQSEILNLSSKDPVPSTPLNKRQSHILSLIAQGKNTQEIAHLLKISPQTIESQRTNIMRLLKVTDTAQLVHYAVQSGLATVE